MPLPAIPSIAAAAAAPEPLDITGMLALFVPVLFAVVFMFVPFIIWL
jgi:hypothetical protein